VPEDIIIYDYAGLRTINSIINAKEVYGLDSVTIISQNYHNERAIWIAEHYDLDAIAYDAHTPTILNKRIKNYGREFLARVKMFLDLIVGDKPKSVPKSNATQRCYYTKKYTNNQQFNNIST
jgi:SanA protein